MKKKHDDDEDETQSASEGHNIAGKFSAQRLKSFITRIERIEEDKRALGTDLRDVYQEAGMSGLDVKAIRRIVQDRRKDKDAITEREETIRIYKEALGDFSNSPLGKAAIDKAK